jgi:hypothetical protein
MQQNLLDHKYSGRKPTLVKISITFVSDEYIISSLSGMKNKYVRVWQTILWDTTYEFEFEFEFWCLTPLSVIFQLYHGDQF